MEKAAKITVAVPTLDRPEALSRCLDGLFTNRLLPAEVVIVDQGQGDTTLPVIDRFRSGSTPIIHCRQTRQGLSAARNLGWSIASCQIIAFTDDDCVPDPGWIEGIDRAFTSFPTACGVTGRILPLGPEVPGRFAVSLRTGNKSAEFRGRALPWSVGSGGNFAVKRDWLDRIGGYDENLGAGSNGKAAEDMDLFYRLLRSGAIIRYEPKVMIYHERQDRAHLILSGWNYGYGMGAFAGKYLHKGDFYATYILGVWLFWLFWQMGSFMVHRDRSQAGGSMLRLRGCFHGLAYGFKLG
jgi:glycosyltransferase involved in cell wall biosynthesis